MISSALRRRRQRQPSPWPPPFFTARARPYRRRKAQSMAVDKLWMNPALMFMRAFDRLRRLFLIFLFPVVIGHAVDDLARRRIGERHAALFRRLAIPARKAITAEASKIHEIEVLHIGALA